MHDFTLMTGAGVQAFAQAATGSDAPPMVLLLVFVGLFVLTFWRQIMMVLVALVFAVFAFGLLQAISTMQQ